MSRSDKQGKELHAASNEVAARPADPAPAVPLTLAQRRALHAQQREQQKKAARPAEPPPRDKPGALPARS